MQDFSMFVAILASCISELESIPSKEPILCLSFLLFQVDPFLEIGVLDHLLQCCGARRINSLKIWITPSCDVLLRVKISV